MLKQLALVATTLTFVAAGQAYATTIEGAEGGPGAVPAATTAAVGKYFVNTCSDYLAKPASERGAVIAWMSHFVPETGGRNRQEHDPMVSDLNATPQVAAVDAACKADPGMGFGHLLAAQPNDQID